MKLDRPFFMLSGCFALSGAAGLIYETVWTQQFGLVFGTSEVAVAAVLAAYMAGLMVGAWFVGRWLSHLRASLLLYAFLELGIALCALAVPTAIRWASLLQERLFGGLEVPAGSESFALTFFDLAASFLILLPATAMMGATLPLLARHAVRFDSEIGLRIGILYTANTIGAASGTLLAAFVLLPRLGLGRTVLVAVALNGLVFVLAALLARAGPSHQAQAKTVEKPAIPIKTTAPSEASDRGWILPLIALSGFVSLSYEVLWTRLLSHLLGGSIYAFATMLATFLIGIALGSAVASRFASGVAASRRGFAVAQLGVAATFYAAFAAVDLLADRLGRSALEDVAFLSSGVALAALTLLPGALFLGASFPFAVRVLAGDAAAAGSASARVFAWNTLGAIGGAISAGFVLLPRWRYDGTALVTVTVSLLVAFIVAGLPRPRRHLLAATALVGLGVLVARPPQTPWQVLRTSSFSGRPASGEVAFYSVGRSATVLLLERLGEWRLTTNGLPESAIQPPGARVGRFTIARWLALLPHLGHPDVRSTLVIGLGAGLTLAAVPASVEELHLVELEPEVIAANRAMAEVRNVDPLADPRLRIHLNDARSALLLTDKRFDAIVSQPSHPWTAGASHLFTREFFALAHDRLTEDGVFVQWIGLRFVDEALLRSLIATLSDVFPHVEIFNPSPGGAILFLAGKKPLRVEEHAARALEIGREEWTLMGLTLPADLLAARVLDEDGCRRLAAGAPISTDHHNLLQIRSPLILHAPLGLQGADHLMAGEDPLLEIPEDERFYFIRRLVIEKRLIRARSLADSLQDPVRRSIALALIDLSEGRRQQGEQSLWQALPLEENGTEALSALVRLHRAALIQGTAPEVLIAQVSADPAARAVVEGWRLARLRNFRALEQLDQRFESFAADHPLYSAASRLRVRWRQATRDPLLAAEALELFDPLIAVGKASDRDLIQRTLLAALAGDAEVALASAWELTALLARRPKLPDSRRQVLRILRKMPGLAEDDPRWIRLQRAFSSARRTDH